MKRRISFHTICRRFGFEFEGKDLLISGLFLYGRKTEFEAVLSYATSLEWAQRVCCVSQVKAIVIKKEHYELLSDSDKEKCSWIFSNNPEEAFYDIHDYLLDETDFYERYSFSPQIGRNSRIHETAIVENGVVIGENVSVGPYSVICAGSVIGDNVEISASTVIGDDGFQVIRINGKNRKVRHCGGTLIGDNVYIGSQNIIHRSLFEGATKIGNNVKIDTQVYIAHNCCIGDEAVITAGCILCGSSTVESGAWIGPNSSILNKVVVSENSMVGMGSVVTKTIPSRKIAYGVPAKVKKG